MTYNDYKENRTALMNEAQSMIDSGDLEGAAAKQEEVKALDARWDATKEALDNLQALSDEQRAYNVQNLTGATVENGTATAQISLAQITMDDDGERMLASAEYERAWARVMMGHSLTADDQRVFNLVNEYTHTTGNTGIVIPSTTADGIWDLIEEAYPYYADIQKTYVKGSYKYIVSDTSTDAAWYDEETRTEDGKETFREISLDGCELARAITVSWKLREMAIADFIPFIQRKLAEKMGAAVGYGVLYGKGKPSASDSFKPEPTGVITALKAEDGKPQVVGYAAGKMTYADITAARSRIKAGAAGLAIYANSETIWSVLANVKDENGRPIFIPDPTADGVYRILSMVVKEDSAMATGDVLLSNPGVGYVANINKDISVLTEEHAKDRVVDYCGYAIMDGNVTTTKAHALLTGEAQGET